MVQTRLIVLAVVAGLFLWLFADALLGSGMFAFRDAAHFYYPLFRFIADQWAAGRVPLWNPYENLGQPLAGNPAASVFYPGKLIFALPLSYPWAYKLYVMTHLLLAAWAAYRLARHWGASVEAAGVCAISYALSGNVLFTYCNVVFLVGAAWLPVAMRAADRMLVQGSGVRGQGSGARDERLGRDGRRRARWAVAFGAVLALMALGGDPQMAYNAGLLAAMYALWLWWDGRRPGHVARTAKLDAQSESSTTAQPVRHACLALLLRSRPALLALAAVTGLILSAVQVLPSIEFARHSERAADGFADRLLCRIEPGTHSEHIYHFSVGPWRLAEYIWPNFSGRQFPVHRRWLEVIPAEGRIWTPSLYMGLLPLLLALAAIRLRRGQPRDRWLSWSVLLAVAASFGWYGLGWLMQEIRVATGGDPSTPGPVGAPFGGLYWLMTVLLPGYAYFRYPAKLLVVAALGLSVLAARGWDCTFAGPSGRFRRGLLWLGGMSACGAIAALAIRLFGQGWPFSRVEPDMLFGPLDAKGALTDLLWAFGQTAVLCGLFWWVLGRANSGARWMPAVALALVAADLAVANRWMVVCARAEQWEEPSKSAAILEQEESESEGQPYRVFRHPIWTRPAWKARGSPDRLSEAMRWERDTLWPKYNLAGRIPLAEVHGAMMLQDYELILSLGERGRSSAGSQLPVSLAKYVILPGGEVLPGGKPLDVRVADVSLWQNPRHLPRAWIVRQVDLLPPLTSTDLAEMRWRTEEVFCPDGRPRNLRRSALVETNFKLERASTATDADSCHVVYYDPLRVEIEAELARPGLVVLGDQFYPGWMLQVETAGQPVKTTGKLARSVPILRTNRVMRGAWLPAGEHRLLYRYRPASFMWGATISGLGWIVLAAMGVGFGIRRPCATAGSAGLKGCACFRSTVRKNSDGTAAAR